jgi:hypothetical protein
MKDSREKFKKLKKRMYIERLILGDIKGEDLRQFHHILGYTELIKTCNELKDHPELTKLAPNLDGMDPGFSLFF